MLKVSFVGYIGADCNQKIVNDQVAIRFSVGVTDQYKNRQGEKITTTTWIGCTIWRKPENTRIAEFLKKGQQVYVEGEPSTRAWISNADTQAKSSLDCRVSDIELLGKATVAPQSAQPSDNPSVVVAQNGDNDDLPF